MKRTTIMLPQSLRVRTIKRAQSMGISLGGLMRRAPENMLSSSQTQLVEYPFLEDNHFFAGQAAEDLAKNHDYYLYGDGK